MSISKSCKTCHHTITTPAQAVKALSALYPSARFSVRGQRVRVVLKPALAAFLFQEHSEFPFYNHPVLSALGFGLAARRGRVVVFSSFRCEC